MKKFLRIQTSLLSVFLLFGCAEKYVKSVFTETDGGAWEKYEYEYDKNGNVISEIFIDSVGTAETNQYVYSKDSVLIREAKYHSDYGSSIVEYGFDTNGLPAYEYFDIQGGSSKHGTNFYRYDNEGNLLESEFINAGIGDNENEKVEYIYDESGFLLKEIYEYDGNLLYTLEYSYDSNGNVLSEKSSTSWPDNLDMITSYQYDSMGRVIEESSETGSGISEKTTREYDDAGHVIREYFDFDGDLWEEIACSYNEQGLLTEKKYSNSFFDEDMTTYQYNGDGLLIKEFYISENYSERILYEYDKQGNLLEKKVEYSTGITEISIYEY